MTKKGQDINFQPVFNYIDEKTKNLATKDDISHLPTKDDFYKTMSELSGEVKAEREENNILNDRTKEHNRRLDKIETHLGIASS